MTSPNSDSYPLRLPRPSRRPLTRWQVAGLIANACIRKAQALSRLD